MLTSSAREHAGRASRRSSSTRSTRWRPPSAAPTWRCRWSGSRRSPSAPPQRIGLSATQRPLEEVARFLGGFAEPGRAAAGHHRRRGHPQAARGRGRRPRRGHGRARPAAHGEEPCAAARPPRRSPRRCARASGPASTRASSSWCSPTAPPSSSATPAAWPSAWRRGSTSWPRRARASTPCEPGDLVKAHHGSLAREQRVVIEDQLKRGRAARPGGHVQPRARHRHGRGRPRHPGRVAGRRQPRAAAHRPRRPPGGRAAARARCSRSTAATCSRPRSSCSACATASSRRRATCATRSTCWPSRSWP